MNFNFSDIGSLTFQVMGSPSLAHDASKKCHLCLRSEVSAMCPVCTDPLEMRLVLLPDLLPDRLKVVEDLGLGVEDELPVAAVDPLKAGSQSTEDPGPGGGVKVLRRTTR